MQRTVTDDFSGKLSWSAKVSSLARTNAPTLVDWLGTFFTTLLLILAFPNFNLSILAWVALIPFLSVLIKNPTPLRALLLGWVSGSVFFYTTCYWLTYSMIHYGGIPTPIAYLLLIPGALVIGVFPGLFAFLTATALKRWGPSAVLLAPIFWVTAEWFRLGVTGQLWNALGYSQAELAFPHLLDAARWGGVYAVSFLILTVNVALALVLMKRQPGQIILGCLALVCVVGLMFASANRQAQTTMAPSLYVVAVQPNVPMTIVKTIDELKELRERHFVLSKKALDALPSDNIPRLLIWPESPMNFTYAQDRNLQDQVGNFVRENRTSLILNSLEPAPNDGSYNSALLINEEGRLIAQYDKIRLMPFGEYVPLPQWLGGSLISGLVGEFTPGDKYTLMPVADRRAGVFICIESAYPWIARRLTSEGADLLINISNDGYLGPTAVMHQHLANTIFRAVENGRPLLRVTNTGLTASIRSDGSIDDITRGFEIDVRTWKLSAQPANDTFYSKHGDVFVQLSAAITILIFIGAVYRRRSSEHPR